MKYTLSVLVENQPGVLSKVVGLFSRRGYNLDSVAVGATEDSTTSWSRWKSSLTRLSR